MSVRCEKCGLVNFPGTLQCRRCGFNFIVTPFVPAQSSHSLGIQEDWKRLERQALEQFEKEKENKEWERQALEQFEKASRLLEVEQQQERERKRQERNQYLLHKFQNENIVYRIMIGQLCQEDSQEVVLEMFGNPEIIDREILKTKIREVWKYDKAAKNQYNLIITIENNAVTKFVTKGDVLKTLNLKILIGLNLIEPEYINNELEDDVLEGLHDDLFDEAIKVVCQMSKASTSVLQRRLRISYGRAAAIIDMMEREGYVEPPDGSKPRTVKQCAYDYLEALEQKKEN